MKPIIATSIAIAATLLASCAQKPQATTRQHSSSVPIQPHTIHGTVSQISSGHGNAYTDIRPDRYESLSLVAGKQIHVAFGETKLTLMVGRDYAGAPSGTPLAVLHRDGLTFAIRDGNFSKTYGIAASAGFTLSTAETPVAGKP